MHDHRQRIDRITVHQDRHLHKLAGAVFVDGVIKAGIAAGNRFQPIIEIEHHLVQRQPIDRHRAVAGIGQVDLLAAALGAKRQHRPQIFIRRHDGGLDPGLLDLGDLCHLRHVGRVVKADLGTVRHGHGVDNRRRGRNQIEIEFAFQPVADDLHMEKSEKPAAKAESQRGRGLRLEGEGGVVQRQLFQRLAKAGEVVRVHREQAAEDNRHRRLEPRKRLLAGAALLGDGVADTRIRYRLHPGIDKADLAGAELVHRRRLRREHADPFDDMRRTGAHHADFHALPDLAMAHPHQRHHAEIGVVPAVHQKRGQRRGLVALRRRHLRDDSFQDVGDADACLRAAFNGVICGKADHLFDLAAHPLRFGSRQVDLVQHGHDLVIRLDRLIDVGQRLRLDTLAGIHHQKRALAGRQGP